MGLFEIKLEVSQVSRGFSKHARGEVWDIGEFTYLDPVSCQGTTSGDRKARMDSFWRVADPDFVDGPGAESFNAFINARHFGHKASTSS